MTDAAATVRAIPVTVDQDAVGDGSYPRPVVGDVVTYELVFVESAKGATFRVEVTGGDREPVVGLRWDGTPHDRPPTWHLTVAGDGWTASWSSTRSLTGVHDLTGRLRADPWSGGDEVRGRLLQVDGLRVVMGLDDVPPPEPPPSIAPRAVAADRGDLWVGDAEHPLVLRIGAGGEVVEHSWPGEVVGHLGRTLHPDGHGGCWVVGNEGVRHLDGAGGQELVDPTPARRAAVVAEAMLTSTFDDHSVRVVRRGAPALVVDLDGMRVLDLNADGPSAVLDVVGADGERRPVQLDIVTGHLTPRHAPEVTRHRYKSVARVPAGMDVAALLAASRGVHPRPTPSAPTAPAPPAYGQAPPTPIDDDTRTAVLTAVREMITREQARVDDPVTGAPGGDPTDRFGWSAGDGRPALPVFDPEAWRWFRLLDVAWLHGDIWVRFAWGEPDTPDLEYLTSTAVHHWWNDSPDGAALLVRGHLRDLLSPLDALRSAPSNAHPGWRNRATRTWLTPGLVLVDYLALDQDSHDQLWDTNPPTAR